MFDCPEQSQNSPTSTSSRAFRFLPQTVRTCPRQIAIIGFRRTIQKPSATAEDVRMIVMTRCHDAESSFVTVLLVW